MWLTEKEVESSFEGGSQSEQSTLLIGWPTEGNVCNLFAHFSPTEKQKWFDAINRQRSKITDRNKDVVIIKLHYEDKTSGKRTKKLAVSRNDSIDDVFQKIPKEFLPNADNECKYHVCIKYVDGDTRTLTGHESLYCIQLASDLLLVSTKVEHFSIIRSKGNHVDSVIHSRKQSSQLFGCALHQLCSSNNNNLPKIIMKLLEHLYKIGPLTEGIFRVCYNYKELQTMISSLDTKLTKNDLKEEASNAINADSDVVKNMPVHMTAALFKVLHLLV
ncbi:hypothetical protein HELRODRAFT_181104 [Helobdella robusta]|uniref:Rho-GAP domain-containing protein n=1 Tax=Helobdella robusta TaxID=6412 RepID=T1FGM0_HELRO|nr:hypothetical protein HELRODRAFT_181104 [Helobdella robusta]ESN93358.1 hypothetical protein HELRODRAFT_181104 [Helobdella robusta]